MPSGHCIPATACRLAGRRSQRAIYHVCGPATAFTACAVWRAREKPRHARTAPPARSPCNRFFVRPTAAATDSAKKDLKAMTLQSLLQSKPMLSDRRLVVLDEGAGQSACDMKRLLTWRGSTHRFVGRHRPAHIGRAWRCAADLEPAFGISIRPTAQIRRHGRPSYRKAVDCPHRNGQWKRSHKGTQWAQY